jgi:DNA-binding CsgD family transcriptional regulator/tetratricopeptide (TPR) repeat protein
MLYRTAELIGRDDELAFLADFVAGAEAFPRALILEGEAGIGKTVLLAAGVEAADVAGYTVLAARPSEAETKIAYTVLRDLLGVPFADVSPRLPPPQRHALEVALLLADPGEIVPERGAIRVATLTALRELASARPVVLALDDVQWIDAPSASVLAFAARRLEELPVGLLLTVRSENEAEAPELVTALPEERVRRERIGPLSIGALHTLIRVRLGRTFPRPVLRRLHESSGGNPLYGLELARALERRGGVMAREHELPVPRSLRALVEERLVALPVATHDALAHAAALAEPSLAVIDAALGGAEALLDPAVQAEVITVEQETVAFTHPLLASVLLSGLAAGERRRVHSRLADVVTDPEERARHLAIAAVPPNSAVAELLDDAARAAAARGAPDAAGELADDALRFTPSDRTDERCRRALDSADHHLLAGNVARTRDVLAKVVTREPAGPWRAEALERLAGVTDDAVTARQLFEEARRDAAGDRVLETRVELGLAGLGWRSGREDAAGHARQALLLAEALRDERLLALALTSVAWIETALGRGLQRDLLERAVALEDSVRELPVTAQPSFKFAILLEWVDELDEARSVFARVAERVAERGDAYSLAQLLRSLTALDLRAGNWKAASRHADEGIDAARQIENDHVLAVALYMRATVDAHLGRVESARAAGAEGLVVAESTGAVHAEIGLCNALGLLELSLGNPREAARHLDSLAERTRDSGLREPGLMRSLGDEVEALVALGEVDAADALLEPFLRDAERLQRIWALGVAYRCLGLIAGALGNFGRAETEFSEALRRQNQLPEPFELGRTYLAVGVTLRRAAKRGDARIALDQSLAIFEGLGARLWAERARDELARIGGRVASGELTTAEERIAVLVAEGKSNKEVASELFISVHTVEAALTRVYGKLAVRSRTQLARALTRVGSGGRV